MPGSYDKSAVRANIEKYIKEMSDLTTGSKEAEQYVEFCHELYMINAETQYYYEIGKDGKLPLIDNASRKELLEHYDAAIKAGKKILGSETGPVGDRLKEIITAVEPLLQQDKMVLDMVSPEYETTLPDLIAEGREQLVDFGKQDMKIEAGMMSQRHHIKVNNGGVVENGFFTPTTTANTVQEADQVINELDKKYPEFAQFIQELKNYGTKNILNDSSPFWDRHPFISVRAKSNEQKKQRVDDLLRDIVFCNFIQNQNTLETAMQNPKFYSFVDDFYTKLSDIKQRHDMYFDKSNMGVKEGANIDKRNIATYRMAKLFGKPDLVAEAKPMTIIQNGKPVTGTFMAEAYGVDISKIKEGDKATQYKREAFNNSAIFDDIAAMQAIDFISGNLDRNTANFFMRFEPDDPENAKIAGITLIDNDSAYTSNDIKVDSGTYIVRPEGMVAIGEDFYNILKTMTEDQLRFALRDCELSEKELAKAWERKNLLQAKIEEDMAYFADKPEGYVEEGRLRVVRSDKWSEYKLEDLGKANTNGEFQRFNKGDKLIDSAVLTNKGKEKTKNDLAEARELFGVPIPEPAPEREVPMGNVTASPIFGLEKPPRPEAVNLVIPKLSKLDYMGDNLSRRYLISYEEGGKTKEVFFTPSQDSGARATLNDYFENVIEAKPQFEKEIRAIKDYYATKNLGDYNDFPESSRDLPYEEMGIGKRRKEELLKNYDFNQMISAMSEQLGSLIERNGFLRAFGIMPGDGKRIDTRNVAMSDIAELMGTDKLLAKSRHVNVMCGDRLIEGTIMDRAEGLSLSAFMNEPVHPICKLSEDKIKKAFNDPEGMMSIADIQILDYIGGNTDRHQDNMFYKFEGWETGELKFKGVVGIDNDGSLGIMRPARNAGKKRLAPIDDIKVITEETAARIMSDDFAAKLEEKLRSNGLSQDEINSAKDRLHDLQDAVRDKTIRIVKKDEWGKGDLTFDKLADSAQRSQFQFIRNDLRTAMVNASNRLRQNPDADMGEYQAPDLSFTKCMKVDKFSDDLYQKKEFQQLEQDAEREFLKGLSEDVNAIEEKQTLSEMDMVAKIARDAKALYKKLDGADPTFSFTSRTYKDLKSSVDELASYAKKLGKKLRNQNDVLSEKDGRKLTRLLNNAKSHNAMYRAKKMKEVAEGKGLTVNGSARFSVTADVSQGLDALTTSYNATVSRQLSKNNPVAVAHIKLGAAQESLSRKNGLDFERTIAKIIYYKGITRLDLDTKRGDQIKDALHPENVRSECAKLMETEAFRKLMKLPEEELRKLASEKGADKIMKSFVKELATIKKALKQQEKLRANNQAKRQGNQKDQAPRPNKL